MIIQKSNLKIKSVFPLVISDLFISSKSVDNIFSYPRNKQTSASKNITFMGGVKV